MSKPKLISLAFQCLAWPALALVPCGAGAANLAEPDYTATPLATPATVGNENSFVVLNLTPEAITKENPVVKINLARWFAGATLIKQLPNGDLQQILFQNRTDVAPYDQLMNDDSTTEIPFKDGETRVVIDIGGERTLQSFGFFSFSAHGSLDLYYSNSTEMVKTIKTDPTEWKPINAHTDILSNEAISVSLGAVDAHYIMVVFNMKGAGTISPLSLLGLITTTKDKKATAPNQESDDEEKKKNAKPVNPEDLVEFDYANAAYGTKVTDVSGGNIDQAQNVLGTNPKQMLSLGGNVGGTAAAPATTTPSGEKPAADSAVNKDNIFVVDMGKDHDINKVGLLFKTEGSGTFEFYLLKQLPTKAGDTTPTGTPAAPGATGTPTAKFDSYKPILLAASEGSLAEALILAQNAPGPDTGGDNTIKPVDFIPANFFQNTKPTFTQQVSGSNNDNKITQNYDNNLQFRFALVRWVPATPNQPPVQIFKVNLIGKVPINNFVAASKSNINLGPPTSAVIGPNPPPGQTADPGPTPPPTPPANPNPSPSQQNGTGGGGGGGSSNPTEPVPTPTPSSVTP